MIEIRLYDSWLMDFEWWNCILCNSQNKQTDTLTRSQTSKPGENGNHAGKSMGETAHMLDPKLKCIWWSMKRKPEKWFDFFLQNNNNEIIKLKKCNLTPLPAADDVRLGVPLDQGVLVLGPDGRPDDALDRLHDRLGGAVRFRRRLVHGLRVATPRRQRHVVGLGHCYCFF